MSRGIGLASLRVSRVIVGRPRRTGFRKQPNVRASVLFAMILKASFCAAFQPRFGQPPACGRRGRRALHPGFAEANAPLFSRPNPKFVSQQAPLEMRSSRISLRIAEKFAEALCVQAPVDLRSVADQFTRMGGEPSTK
jgi:hypothetical protein